QLQLPAGVGGRARRRAARRAADRAVAGDHPDAGRFAGPLSVRVGDQPLSTVGGRVHPGPRPAIGPGTRTESRDPVRVGSELVSIHRSMEATMPRRSLAVLAGLALALPIVTLTGAAPAGAAPAPHPHAKVPSLVADRVAKIRDALGARRALRA